MDHTDQMDDLYTIFGARDLWGTPNSAHTDVFKVIEFRQEDGSHQVKAHSREIFPDQCEEWLAEGSQPTPVLARFVWVDIDLENHNINISDQNRERILEAFGLQTAYSYSKSFISGVAALPRVATPQAKQQAFVFCHAPKIAAIWSHSRFRPPIRRDQIVEGIVLAATPATSKKSAKAEKSARFAATGQTSILKDLMQMPCLPSLCASPAFPAYAFSILLSRQIDGTQREAKKWIKEVEGITGFHDFELRKGEKVGTWTMSKLEARTSGQATKMASCERKSRVILKLLAFISRISTEQCETRRHFQQSPSASCDCSMMESRVNLIHERLDMQQIDTAYTLERIRIQIEALFHIVAQRDSESNLNIAKLTRRDSSSMKTLAIVTMVFLPGSFVSALFSTGSFDWDNPETARWNGIGVGITPQFWLFWVITIPLTAAVFGCYFAWLQYLKRHQRHEVQPHQVADEPTEPFSKVTEKLPFTNNEAERQVPSTRRKTYTFRRFATHGS